MNLEELRAKNKLSVFSVHDQEFAEYGRVLTAFDVSDIVKFYQQNVIIPEKVFYTTALAGAEKCAGLTDIMQSVYGGAPIQAGVCCGHNDSLNGLEYHRSSEVQIAVTEFALLLGRKKDIAISGDTLSYDTDKVVAFYASEGTVLELFDTSLHFAPVRTNGEGFNVVIILPKGTNEELTAEVKVNMTEDRYLKKRDKWLLNFANGALKGENIKVV